MCRSRENKALSFQLRKRSIGYRIIFTKVQGFDGHEVSLNVQKAELERFKGAETEDFREVK